MIFQHTIANVLNGKKTQTRRLCRVDDRYEQIGHRRGVLENSSGRWRWIISHTYAVQPGRCHPSLARIRITGLRREENPLKISEADAIAEGFESAEAFIASWKSLHQKNPVQPVWVIEFELVMAKAAIGGRR